MFARLIAVIMLSPLLAQAASTPIYKGLLQGDLSGGGTNRITNVFQVILTDGTILGGGTSATSSASFTNLASATPTMISVSNTGNGIYGWVTITPNNFSNIGSFLMTNSILSELALSANNKTNIGIWLIANGFGGTGAVNVSVFTNLFSTDTNYITASNTVGGLVGWVGFTASNLVNLAQALNTNGLLYGVPTSVVTNSGPNAYVGTQTMSAIHLPAGVTTNWVTGGGTIFLAATNSVQIIGIGGNWLTSIQPGYLLRTTNSVTIGTVSNVVNNGTLNLMAYSSTNLSSVSYSIGIISTNFGTIVFGDGSMLSNALTASSFTNLTTDTPSYLTITNSNGGTNGLISITESNLTNFGAWLSGKSLFDTNGIAATLTGNLSNALNSAIWYSYGSNATAIGNSYASNATAIGASFGSNNTLILNLSNWGLTVFAPTSWVEQVFSPSNWVDSIFFKKTDFSSWSNYNQALILGAAQLTLTNVFTGSTNYLKNVRLISSSSVVTNGFDITAVAPSGGGSNYAVGDIVSFASGTAVTNTQMRIDSVAVAGGSIANAGADFSDGQIEVTVNGGTYNSQAKLNVSVESGAIVSVDSVSNGGDYTAVPSNPVTVTAGAGSGTLNLTWGIGSTVAITVGGFYSALPDMPSLLANISGSGTNGTISITEWGTNTITNIVGGTLIFTNGSEQVMAFSNSVDQLNTIFGFVPISGLAASNYAAALPRLTNYGVNIIPLSGSTVLLDFAVAETNYAFSLGLNNAQTTLILTNLPTTSRLVPMRIAATCGVTGTIVLPPFLYFAGTISPNTNCIAGSNYVWSLEAIFSNRVEGIFAPVQP